MDIRELLDAVAPLATELEDTWVVSQRTTLRAPSGQPRR